MTKNGNNDSEHWSRKAGTEVRERELKLEFFYKGEVGVASERIRCARQLNSGCRRAMALALGLTDNQLKGTKNKPDNLSKAAREILGEKLDFDPESNEFLTGTAREFANWYNQQYQEKPDVAVPERRTDIALDVESVEQWSYDDQLASLELKALQVGEGSSSLACTVNCQITELANLRVQVKRGKLSLSPGKALLKVSSPQPERGTAEKSEQVKRVSVTKCSPASWIIEASSGAIGEIDVPETVIDVVNLAAGDTIGGVFTTYLKEVVKKDQTKIIH